MRKNSECLLEEKKYIFETLSTTGLMKLPPGNERYFLLASNCSICGEKFQMKVQPKFMINETTLILKLL